MMNEIKKQIVDSLKKAREASDITAKQVKEIVQGAVSKTAESAIGGAGSISNIAKEATAAAIKEIERDGKATKEYITSVIGGVADGVKQVEQKSIDAVYQQLQELETKVKDKEERLGVAVKEALEGAKKSTGTFSENIKKEIENAVLDVKLKYAEILGLMRKTVKDAVKQAIKSGKDIEQTVANIVRDTTEKAFAQTRFNAEKIKDVSHVVLSASVEAAEEAGSNMKEVSHGAVKGVSECIATAVEATKKTLTASGDKVKTAIHEDLLRTKGDSGTVADIFLKSIRKVGQRLGKAAKTAGKRLKELGKDAAVKGADLTGKAAHATAKKIKELSRLALKISKGALSGMWKGAKGALKKEEKEK